MIAIYDTSGMAKEYEPKACNLYNRCGHGCTYPCYAALMAVRFGKVKTIEDFFKNPQPREGIIEALRKDAKKLGDQHKEELRAINFKYKLDPNEPLSSFCKKLGKIRDEYPPPPFVFLCFTCDPYQPINEKYQLTRQAIEILFKNGLGVNILTKGKITDFDLLAKNPGLSKIGVTITGAEVYGNKYEPNAQPLEVRLWNLIKAKEYGIRTWVSFEPVIDPEFVLESIKRLNNEIQYKSLHKGAEWMSVVDEFKIGKWNYSHEAKKIDWYKFTNDAIKLLDDLGCKYYIKEDLRRYVK